MCADPKLVEAATRLLVNAPPGEYDDCVSSLSQFASDPEVVTEAKNKSIRTWMMNQCSLVEVGDHQAMICEEALQSSGLYVDPTTMGLFNYNFEEKKVEETGETLESTPFREECQKALCVFSTKTLTNGACGVYDTENGVAIVLSGSSINRENYKTGSVVMRFRIENGRLAGKITAAAHFYENGNCTLENSADFEGTLASEDDDKKAAASAVKLLSDFYRQWTEKLSNGFNLLKTEGLNKLRRRLPVTKTKINWRAEIIGSASMQNK